MNREAELEPPSRVACSDLLGLEFIYIKECKPLATMRHPPIKTRDKVITTTPITLKATLASLLFAHPPPKRKAIPRPKAINGPKTTAATYNGCGIVLPRITSKIRRKHSTSAKMTMTFFDFMACEVA